MVLKEKKLRGLKFLRTQLNHASKYLRRNCPFLGQSLQGEKVTLVLGLPHSKWVKVNFGLQANFTGRVTLSLGQLYQLYWSGASCVTFFVMSTIWNKRKFSNENTIILSSQTNGKILSSYTENTLYCSDVYNLAQNWIIPFKLSRLLRSCMTEESCPCRLLSRVFQRWKPPPPSPQKEMLLSLRYIDNSYIGKIIQTRKGHCTHCKNFSKLCLKMHQIASQSIFPQTTLGSSLPSATRDFSPKW